MTRDMAHVSAVELYTAVPDETVAFFQDLMAMEVVGRRGDSQQRGCGDDRSHKLHVELPRLAVECSHGFAEPWRLGQAKRDPTT